MKDKKKLLINILSILILIVCLTSLTMFSYSLFRLNVLPTKYLVLGYIVLILVIGILFYLIFRKKNIIVKVVSVILVGLLCFSFIYISSYLNNTNEFFESTHKSYDTLNYSVIVLKENNYKKISDLKDKNIAYIDDDYKNDIKNNFKKISYNEQLFTDLSVIADDLLNKNTDAIVLEESYLTLAYEEIKDFKDSVKVIDTFSIKAKVHKENKDEKINFEEPFVLYISGIDQYGNVNSVRGRSDVNQLVVVNPKTHHILLVNTPRDYYVQLYNTTGLRDKLTHAGIYGIDKSIKTLEKFYDIDINYYLRVNFNSLIKVVDVIGGIDIYSDKSFVAHTNKSVNVKKGWNSFNGEQALAYSRERYAYITGDHHRGANQQQVIEAIINKVTQSSVLISKYNSILNALDGTFQTDMSTSMITSFIKEQLNEMPKWQIDSIAVTGYNSSNYTYSMGSRLKLYVMEPDYNSVEKAKKKIIEVLNEN